MTDSDFATAQHHLNMAYGNLLGSDRVSVAAREAIALLVDAMAKAQAGAAKEEAVVWLQQKRWVR